jgi:hypothetical protein
MDEAARLHRGTGRRGGVAARGAGATAGQGANHRILRLSDTMVVNNKSGIHLLLPRAVNAFSTAATVAAGGGVLNISFGIGC